VSSPREGFPAEETMVTLSSQDAFQEASR
jgi:hypothetical protein